MRLPLVPSDSPLLRTPAAPINDVTAVRQLSTNMIETMVAEGGVGLAAPQVGTSLRLFVTGVDGQYLTFINPELSDFSTERILWEEGCLSLPRLLGKVERPQKVTVSAHDMTDQAFSIAADQLLARVLQHEYDHLEGILFPDRMTDQSTLRKLTEEEWQTRYDERGQHDGQVDA